MKNRIFFLFSFILAFNLTINGMGAGISGDEHFSNLRFSQVNTENGLSQASVLCIFQDIQGFVWMGTKDGLNRYDGYNFRTYKHLLNDTTSMSDNEILSLSSDQNGNIYISTQGGGFNKFIYTTNQFIRYPELPISEPTVNTVYPSADGSIWIGTPEGLILGDPIENASNQYRFTNLSKNSAYLSIGGQILPYDRKMMAVHAIQPIENNFILIGTQNGIFIYNIQEKTFSAASVNTQITDKVNSIIRNHDGDIWAGTALGLFRMRWTGNQLVAKTIYDYRNPQWSMVGTDWVNILINDHNGAIWAGTRGGGLIQINSKGELTSYYSDLSNSRRIGDNMINALMIDRTGVLWIGTESRGAALLDLNRKRFNHLENKSKSGINLTNNQVTAISGRGNVVWAGTAFNGLDRIDFSNGKQLSTLHIDQIPIGSNRFSSEIISLMIDNKDQLWIGTQSNSVIKYSNGNFQAINIGGFAFALLQDRNNTIWVGTWGQGIAKIDPETNQTTLFNNQISGSNTLSSDKVLSLYDDSYGNLWVGTKGGGINIIPLNLINQGYTSFRHIKHIPNSTNSLLNNDVFCIMQDSKGTFWIGTGLGLSKLQLRSKNASEELLKDELSFETFTEVDGLPGNAVFGIHEDLKGNLWLSTINGLSKFDPNNKTFSNFHNSDGLQSTEFHSNASYKAPNGNLFIGGVNGLSFFNPEEISTNPHPAMPVISRLRVMNQPVYPQMRVMGKRILTNDISLTKDLKLSHKHKEFTIEFSALHFANINKVSYAYRLLGFNDQWHISSGKENSATYTNLKEGDYTFQVKATNNDGVWSDTVTELHIEVKPPFWRNPWFYLVYVGIILSALFMFRKYSLIAVSEKNRLHIERLERKNIIDNTEAKMRFFTNISHEIRTPLTLISNPLSEVIEKGNIDEKSKSNLKLVSKNVSRLLNLTNQLLQLRRIDKGGIEPAFSQVEMNLLLQEINTYFIQKATQKNIILNFRNETDPKLTAWIDQEMITTCIYNILSNAMKFTPSNGHIDIKLSKKAPKEDVIKNWKISELTSKPAEWIAISIADSGKGIPEEELQKIFIRFYQTKHHDLMETAGSGIGLSIVKEYIDLHLGVVSVHSKLGEGTEIILYLPLGKKHLPQKPKAEETVKQNLSSPTQLQTLENAEANEPELEEAETYIEVVNTDEFPHILIVEDDAELANYLASSFEEEYSVTLAANGLEGMNKAIDLQPDLIISDVMMPEMDGTQMSKALKNNIETSHIPIILLTARASDTHMIEGYESGADMYVTKPFAIEVLRTQVKQLILSRRQLIEKFSRHTMLKPRDLKISSLDERFLDKLYSIIEANLAEPDFDVSEIVKQMNLSHSTVLKKVKALTGTSMVEFVKMQRLKRAAQILATDKLPISEVAYMVGFSDPKYFSKCFSKEFGRTPSEFATNPDKFIIK